MKLQISPSDFAAISASLASPSSMALALDARDVEAAAVVGDLDDDVAALVAGADSRIVPLRGLPAAIRSAGALDAVVGAIAHQMGERILDQFEHLTIELGLGAVHLAVRCPCRVRRHRSRTMRGSFCQALPIGCMRVFITPSCSSAVTFDSRCSGTLKSESSLRRTISRSWLRVSTSSETVVIR